MNKQFEQQITEPQLMWGGVVYAGEAGRHEYPATVPNKEFAAVPNVSFRLPYADTQGADIWIRISNMEKEIKLLIERELENVAGHFKAEGNDKREVQRKILEKLEGKSWSLSRYDFYIEKNLKCFEVHSSYLDVMSLSDAFLLIGQCWEDIFSKYFNKDPYAAWDFRFEKCVMVRNFIAHGNEMDLPDLPKKEAEVYCMQILKMIENSYMGKSSAPSKRKMTGTAAKCTKALAEMPSAEGKLPEKSPAGKETEYKTPIESLLGQEVDMVIEKLGGRKNPNLKGTISYKCNKYHAVIPCTYLQDLNGADLEAMIGKTVRGMIKRINRKTTYELQCDKDKF